MKISKINVLRKVLMQKITKNVGKSQFDRDIDLSKIEIKKILICRPNHRLGNLLLITPLLQEIIDTFPQCEIDLFVRGNLASILFKNHENVNRIIKLPGKPFDHLIKYSQAWISLKKQHYDIVINVDKNSSSGRLSTQFSNSKFKIFGDLEEDVSLKYKDYEHFAKFPVYNFRNSLNKLGFMENQNPIPPLNLKLSPLEIAEGEKKLKKLVNNDKKTISLFTHATGSKCYSEVWWENFYGRLKEEYQKDYNIIEILPIENISKISFKAPSFYSKDVREIGSLMANTEVFIGADSGMMHLASAAQTPTVGLFSVTNPNKYGPYNNKSVAINTNTTNTNESIEILNSILNSN